VGRPCGSAHSPFPVTRVPSAFSGLAAGDGIGSSHGGTSRSRWSTRMRRATSGGGCWPGQRVLRRTRSAAHDHGPPDPLLGCSRTQRGGGPGEPGEVHIEERRQALGLLRPDDRLRRHGGPPACEQHVHVARGEEVPPPGLGLRSPDQDHHIRPRADVLRRGADRPPRPATRITDDVGRPRQEPVQW
jgi:hypothetical protein